MNIKASIFITLLTLLPVIISKPHLPTLLYSRTDNRWKDYQLFDGSTIGQRADVIDPTNCFGSRATLDATVTLDYKIPCDGQDCTPVTLYEFVQKHMNDPIDIFEKLFKIKGYIVLHSADDIVWETVNGYLNEDSALFFITKPVQGNAVGHIYDIDLNAKSFKYYDDLGQTGTANFGDVAWMEVILFNLSGLKFLE
jgi:hypothetical protein